MSSISVTKVRENIYQILADVNSNSKSITITNSRGQTYFGGMLMRTRSELQNVLDRVCDESKKIYGEMLNRIILYGSYARGDNKEDSDIDIMIILDCNDDEAKKLRSATSEMASDISLAEDVFLSVLLRGKKHFEENAEVLPFYQNIIREGIEVYG